MLGVEISPDMMLIRKQSLPWTYLQTPQFTISTNEQFIDFRMELSVRYGAITGGSFTLQEQASSSTFELPETVAGLKLHEVTSWEDDFCSHLNRLVPTQRSKLATWLHKMLPAAA